MNDKELLQAAARAFGYKVLGLASKWIAQGVSEHALLYRNDRGGDSVFDPLTDPGDALRLAVALHIELKFQAPDYRPYWTVLASERGEWVIASETGSDPLAATMRAITMVAAEIGRTKP